MSDSNNSVKIALLGYGYWGSKIARSILQSNLVSLAAIVEQNNSAKNQAAKECPGVSLHSDLNEIIKSHSVDGIIVATPAGSHFEIANNIIANGINLLVEKPITLSYNEAYELVESSQKNNVLLMSGYTFLYSPAVRFIKNQIDSNRLGKIQYIDSQRLLGIPRNDCSALWDLGSHDISILTYLSDEMPIEVSGFSLNLLKDTPYDLANVNLRYASGLQSTIRVGWVHYAKVRLLSIIGTKQMVSYNDLPLDHKVTIWGPVIDGLEDQDLQDIIPDRMLDPIYSDFERRTSRANMYVPELSTGEPLQLEIEEFAKSIRHGGIPPSSNIFSLKVTRILEAIDESISNNGKSVEVKKI
jgi:predicted dehydrogenase